MCGGVRTMAKYDWVAGSTDGVEELGVTDEAVDGALR